MANDISAALLTQTPPLASSVGFAAFAALSRLPRFVLSLLLISTLFISRALQCGPGIAVDLGQSVLFNGFLFLE